MDSNPDNQPPTEGPAHDVPQSAPLKPPMLDKDLVDELERGFEVLHDLRKEPVKDITVFVQCFNFVRDLEKMKVPGTAETRKAIGERIEGKLDCLAQEYEQYAATYWVWINIDLDDYKARLGSDEKLAQDLEEKFENWRENVEGSRDTIDTLRRMWQHALILSEMALPGSRRID